MTRLQLSDYGKVVRSKNTLAKIADRVTEYLLGEQTLVNANMALVLIREDAQDALGTLIDEGKNQP